MGTGEWQSFALAFTLFCSQVLVGESTWDLTLLHTNDVHARVEETSKDSGKCTKPPCYGGVARRQTKISEIRKSDKNVLLLDGGDQFQGTVWFNFYKGAEAAHFMNKLGYDAMVRVTAVLPSTVGWIDFCRIVSFSVVRQLDNVTAMFILFVLILNVDMLGYKASTLMTQRSMKRQVS